MRTQKETFAIALTVKNESELLAHIIPYYLSHGASKIYIFFDGTTDDSRRICEKYKSVELSDCVNIELLGYSRRWINELNPAEKMDHRKRINTMYAAERAAKEGINWIASLDPDEIVLPPNGCADILDMFSLVNSNTDQIILKNIELIPKKYELGDNPFQSQRLFVRRRDLTTNFCRTFNAISKKFLDPRQRAKIENMIYRTALCNLFPRILKNPIDNSKIYPSLFIGYNNSKAFMRSCKAKYYMFNIHKWQKIQKKPRSVALGRVLHYDFPSADYFLNKFRQRPASMQLAVFDTRYQLGRIARDAPPAVAIDFFENSICLSSQSYEDKLIKSRIIEKIDEVAERFSNINYADFGRDQIHFEKDYIEY